MTEEITMNKTLTRQRQYKDNEHDNRTKLVVHDNDSDNNHGTVAITRDNIKQ